MREVSAANARYMDAIDTAIENAVEVVKDSMPAGREQAVVLTKLDEAQMWAQRGLSSK